MYGTIVLIAVIATAYMAFTAKDSRTAEYWGLALVAIVMSLVVAPIAYDMIAASILSKL